MLQRSAIQPMMGGLIASPSAWIAKMFSANAVARIAGGLTLAKAVLLGPVLKKRQKTARNRNTHASGNGTNSTARNKGNPASIPTADTRKYDPPYLGRRRSPAIPPRIVANSPATTTIPPD